MDNRTVYRSAHVARHRQRRIYARTVVATVVCVLLGVGVASASYALGTSDTGPTAVTGKAIPAVRTDACAVDGPAQRQVEEYLAAHPQYGPVNTDGKQSDQDCAAIKKLQTRWDIAAPTGGADALTGRVVKLVRSARIANCPGTDQGLLICVDLTTQTMWVLRDGAIVLGPTIIRSGRAGEETPTGEFTIAEKKVYTVSTIANTPMRQWQHLRDGYGFHQAWRYLHDPAVPGSAGCVNLTRQDAEDLFRLTEIGTQVRIFGRKANQPAALRAASSGP